MNPSEVEFLGEKQLVSIVPNFNSDVIYLISGSVGPFRAGLPVKVPIWLAVCLKQKQKCRIVSQEWMEIESLNERKETEKMSKLFTEMPSCHYMDESQILLNVANDDIPDADGIRIAVKDIWDIRMSKLRTSVDAFVKSEGVHARLDHLTAMEINGIRPLLPHALDQMLRIQTASTGEINSQHSSGTVLYDLRNKPTTYYKKKTANVHKGWSKRPSKKNSSYTRSGRLVILENETNLKLAPPRSHSRPRRLGQIVGRDNRCLVQK